MVRQLSFAIATPPSTVNGTRERRTCRTSPSLRYTCCATAGLSKSTPLLEMRNITYDVPRNLDVNVFTNMNFKIYPEEYIVIIGQNGAGKTTALNLMTGLVKVKRGNGDIFYKGEKMKPSNLMQNIGVVMQNPANYFFMPTVLDELVLGRDKSPDDVRRVLSAVGLNNISLMAPPASLSGGQGRRLAIASQLLRDPLPSLFVLDEPLAGLDWTARRDIIELLGSLKSQFAVVIVSHEPSDLLEFADRVVEVGRGGMHEIDRNIVQKAVVVRNELRKDMRAKAIQEAMLYNQNRARHTRDSSTSFIA